ncbi:MAG: DUF4350 domain-containing protein [Bacteroidota bacterium]
MKRNYGYYLFFALFITLYLVLTIGLEKKEIDWSFSFSGKEKSPYGSYVLKEEIMRFFPEADIRQTEKRLFNTLNPEAGLMYEEDTEDLVLYDKHSTLFLLNSTLPLDQWDIEELLYFISMGNDAFIATHQMPANLLDTLGIKINLPNILFGNANSTDSLSAGDTAIASFLNPNLNEQNGYYFNSFELGYSISKDEEAETPLVPIALSVNNQDSINMVRVDIEDGRLFVCTAPLAFTNYHMLSGPNLEYVETALSHLEKQTERVIWDEYYKEKNLEQVASQKNPLRYILSQKGLRWAFWMTIVIGLIFGIFEAKRKQRMIPVILPLPNSTLDFTETIGRLYYQNSTHKELCDKKIKLWLSYVYHRYGIEVSSLDDEFIQKVAGKTGIQIETIQNLVRLAESMQRQTSVSENEFMELNHGLNDFYQEVSL